MTAACYGILAEFASSDALLNAARGMRSHGHERLEAYTPYAVEGLSEALGIKPNRVPLMTLAGGTVGGVGGYFMQWYAAAVSYPINVGGRPLHSWPMFIPVTFELTILCAAFAAAIGMLAANGLPRLRHPIFDAPGFDLATRNRHFLCVRPEGPDFDRQDVREALARWEPVAISEVAA